MPIVLDPSNEDNRVNEKSSAFITITFKDRTDQLVTPTAAIWSLTNSAGTAINSRSEIAIGSLATSVEVVISGDDLAISDGFTGNSEKRIFTVEAVYDSDIANDLPLKESLVFYVDNLVAIT